MQELLGHASITTSMNTYTASVPAVLREEHHEAWLRGSPQEAKASLVSYPSDTMVAWQVSRRLYAVKTPNDGGLIEPIAHPRAPAVRS